MARGHARDGEARTVHRHDGAIDDDAGESGVHATDDARDGERRAAHLFEKVRGDHDFIFYNQTRSQDGSVEHTGDNRTGDGDGDDEAVTIDLGKVSPDVQKIAITVTIHDADSRGQNFGQVQNAFIRVVNNQSHVEIVRFDLNEDYSTETAMIFGELYRHNGEWKFRAVGQGYNGGLRAMCHQYGINI